MTLGVVRRQAALASVALVAALAALALSRGQAAPDAAATAPAAPAGGGWQEARAGTLAADAYRGETACGTRLTRETVGVAHPVLPCGAQLVVSYGGREARAPVVERGPYGAPRQLDLTRALADALGVDGVRVVRWRFAQP